MLAFQNNARGRLELPGMLPRQSRSPHAAKFDLCFSLSERRAPDGTPEGIAGRYRIRHRSL